MVQPETLSAFDSDSFDAPSAVALLERLVGTPSVSRQEREAVAVLVEDMNDRGLEAHVDEVGNAVGIRCQPDEQGRITREIVLLGHIDTVPGTIPVRIERGRLYGRGSVDAKGPLATFVVAAATAALSPGLRVVVVGAVEEEVSSSRGAHFVASQYQPDGCVIGEPSGWDGFALGYKGAAWIEFQQTAPCGHSAGPQPTVAEAAVEQWRALSAVAEGFNRDRTALFEQLLCSLTSLQTGSDGLHETVEARMGVRLPPEFDLESLMAQLRSGVGSSGQLSVGGHLPAYRTASGSDLERALRRSIRAAGGRPRPKLKTGTSDMNVVGPRWGCPVIAYGPGDSRLDHTPEEHLVLDEYLIAIRVLSTVLQSA